jgi:hypothetical protein
VIGQNMVEPEACGLQAQYSVVGYPIPTKAEICTGTVPASVQQVAGRVARSEAKRGGFSSYPQAARSAKPGPRQQFPGQFQRVGGPGARGA